MTDTDTDTDEGKRAHLSLDTLHGVDDDGGLGTQQDKRDGQPVTACEGEVEHGKWQTTVLSQSFIPSLTALLFSCSKEVCVCISTPESQQPKPGCEWYQPTTASARPGRQGRKQHNNTEQTKWRTFAM
jgi:hypothetical protein